MGVDMSFENETCEGCTAHTPEDSRHWRCWRTGRESDWLPCEHFQPSLECRKVRALEKIGAMIGATVVMGRPK